MSSPQITLETAYNEACQALGEALVEKRLMAKAASAQIEALTAERDAASAKSSGT